MPNLIGGARSRRRKRDDKLFTLADIRDVKFTLADISRVRGMEVLPIHLLFECASGYAIFLAHGITEIDMNKFEAVEEYINRSPQPLELIDFQPFSSDEDALLQLNAISKSTPTDKLTKFLKDNLPPPFNRHSLATSDAVMGGVIVRKTGLGSRCAILTDDVMRGLREKIDQLIGLEPGELEKAQLNLARLSNDQRRTETNPKCPVVVSSSSYLQEQVGVVPHRFEGIFNVKGKQNILCTRNLVPGEVLYGEKLIRVQNDEDRTEVEYRLWDPLRSKLGAAILSGVTNIWIKPGSRVLYVGNVCGLTVSNLSDLVGLDGLVYVVGFSDDVADMAGNRPNVVTITEKCYKHCHYRMLVGMVDVIFAEIDHRLKQFSREGRFILNNAHFYLRAGGHYMISTQANDGRVIFADCDRRKEFKLIETVMLDLDLMDGAYALDVGGYRMLEE